MPALFKQSDFSGGLNAKLDATKIPRNGFPLLINGRTRKSVVSPTNKHVKLDAPPGNYQGLYITGTFILLFISGQAYFADATDSPIIFTPVVDWQPFDASVSRITAELVPATSNLFNYAGTPDTGARTFNSTIAIFQQAIFCFDGVNPGQAVLPSGQAVPLGSYATWTKDNPLYVPIGKLPAFASNKLFLASPDGSKILHSVSGRASDFVVNLAPSGDKGGDADTVSQTVSFNAITAIRSISTGQVLVGTLYGTFLLNLDYDHTIFGEPYLLPVFLFPAGPINEISVVDILSDTAMITQSGIHAFNAVAQAKRESNNFPLGAQIRGLITDPNTGRALIQKDTCAGIFDDYAMFAMNTVHGYGVFIYDTLTETFQSLDLSFGHVKQFASTRIDGVERLFFITHNNEIYEGFADSTSKNTTRILLGEWTPQEAPQNIISYMVDAVFANVKEAGQVKFSLYSDHRLVKEVIVEVPKTEQEITLPVVLPFRNELNVASVGMHHDHFRSWRLSCMVEWNFAGDLTDFSVDGKIEDADNARLGLQTYGDREVLAFTADSGYNSEYNPGGNFGVDGFVIVPVTAGSRYIYFANGNGVLANGNTRVSEGVFIAKGSHVAIQGIGGSPMTFSLRNADNYLNVLDAIEKERVKALIHGGDFGYENGTELDILMAKKPIRIPFYGLAGNHDLRTSEGLYFYNHMQFPRHYIQSFDFVDVFFYNGDILEPDGIDADSMQTDLVRNWLSTSTKPYKLLVVHYAPYTTDNTHYPGEVGLRFLGTLPGLSAVLCGHAHNMEVTIVNNFPYFCCGAGGHSLRPFRAYTSNPTFRDNTHYGYILIEADALTCKLSYKDTDGNVLYTYALYS